MAEFTGKIIQMLDVQTGTTKTGKAWSKQLIIVEETTAAYPRKACFTFFGEDRVFALSTYQVGNDVTVSYAPESREFGGRWYTDLSAWRIEHVIAQPTATPQPSAAQPTAAPQPSTAQPTAAPQPQATASTDPAQPPLPPEDDFVELPF